MESFPSPCNPIGCGIFHSYDVALKQLFWEKQVKHGAWLNDLTGSSIFSVTSMSYYLPTKP